MKINNNIDKINIEMEEELKTIPDELLNTFTNFAIKDSKKMINTGDNKNLQTLTYILYRAYVLGFLMGKNSKKFF